MGIRLLFRTHDIQNDFKLLVSILRVFTSQTTTLHLKICEILETQNLHNIYIFFCKFKLFSYPIISMHFIILKRKWIKKNLSWFKTNPWWKHPFSWKRSLTGHRKEVNIVRETLTNNLYHNILKVWIQNTFSILRQIQSIVSGMHNWYKTYIIFFPY